MEVNVQANIPVVHGIGGINEDPGSASGSIPSFSVSTESVSMMSPVESDESSPMFVLSSHPRIR